MERTPIWWMSVLPFDTLYMKGVVPVFNRVALFAGITVDWDFWHNWFHEDVIRAGYFRLTRALNFFDGYGVDGLVNGTGRFTRALSGSLRRLQSGFVRNYALGVLLGVVVVLLIFVVPFFMN